MNQTLVQKIVARAAVFNAQQAVLGQFPASSPEQDGMLVGTVDEVELALLI